MSAALPALLLQLAIASSDVPADDAVAAAVRSALSQRLAALGRTAQIHVLAGASAPKGFDGAAPEVGIAPGPFPRRELSVPVLFKDETGRSIAAHVRVALDQPGSAYVYDDNYAKGTDSAAVRVHEAVVNLACCERAAARAIDVGVRELAHSVSKGEPMLEGDFVPAAVVRRGSEVAVEAGHAPVRLHLRGVALESGNPGERISVRTNEVGLLTARVSAPGEVVVDE